MYVFKLHKVDKFKFNYINIVNESMGVVDESMKVVDENLGVVDRPSVGVVKEMGSSMGRR